MLEGAVLSGATIVEAHYPGAGAALAAVSPSLSALLNAVAQSGIARMTHVAEVESGLTADELAGRLSQSVDGMRLLARAVDVARTAGHDDKLRALGRCLKEGATGSRIDVELLLVNAVDALEEVHMRALKVMMSRNSGSDYQKHLGGRTSPIVQVTRDYWAADELRRVDPELTQDVAESIVGHLSAQGVVVDVDLLEVGKAYKPSWLGWLLLERAQELEQDSDSES